MVRPGSKEFIEQPDNWPTWPLLPVKNRERRDDFGPSTGLIHAAQLTIVRLGNMFDMNREKWDNAEKLEFADVQALVDAGWEPD